MFKSNDFSKAFQAKGKPVFSDMFESSQAKAQATPKTPTPEQIKLVYEKAYQKGLAQGISEGTVVARANVQQELTAERQALFEIAQSFRHAIDQHQEVVAKDLLALAVKVAKIMVKDEIRLRDDAVLPVIKDVIGKLPSLQKPVRIFLNSKDINVVSQHLSVEIEELGFELIESPLVDRGGCMIETPDNSVDAKNETRWSRITEALGLIDHWVEV